MSRLRFAWRQRSYFLRFQKKSLTDLHGSRKKATKAPTPPFTSITGIAKDMFKSFWNQRPPLWPTTKKPDLIFFDPPYYTKKEKAYKEKTNENTPSISSYSKEKYEEFIERFLLLAHQNVKGTTRIAFLNADWPARHRSRPTEAVSAAQGFRSGEAGGRDFQSTSVLKENPDSSITIFDYHRMLSGSGWKVTHRIECPLSSERLSGNQVQKMQEKRILGTVGRTLLIAKIS